MKQALFLILLLAAGVSIHASSADARRAAVVYDAILKETCAPWDGSALSVRVELTGTGEVFTAMVWGEGLSDLWQGKEVTFAKGGAADMKSTGYANLCTAGASDKDCPSTAATLLFSPHDQIGQSGAHGELGLPIDGDMERRMHIMLKPVKIESSALCG